MSSFKRNLFRSGLILNFFFLAANTYCQKPERIHTIFTNDAKFGYLWSPGIQLNSVFKKITSEFNLYGGLLINEKVLIGAAGGANVGYPQISYMYIGMIGQYIYKPENFLHYSWQTILGYGSLNVYDRASTGSQKYVNAFYLMEPGVNVEINLGRRFRLVTGIGYRFVPFRGDRSSSATFFTVRDLRGLSLRIGLVLGHLLEVQKSYNSSATHL